MLNLQRRWYQSTHDVVTFCLLPLSYLFRVIVYFRRKLYCIKFKKSVRFSVPIIVVGNITIGGTGKTPFVVWLAHFLKQQGYKPGIVSRGVGGKQQRLPRWVEEDSDPQAVGDEAVLLVNKSRCPVVIGVDRVAAVRELLSKADCNIVISDDGLQHYRLERDIEIALLDGARGLGNKSLLPAGPLREAPSRLQSVDFVVQQGFSNESLDATFMMTLQGDKLISLRNQQQTVSLTHFQQTTVHAVAAIGNPTRFFTALRAQGLQVVEHVFPDHYLYVAGDFKFSDNLPIVMTEKDAVKCREFADERFWYLPVEMVIDGEFGKSLLDKLNLL